MNRRVALLLALVGLWLCPGCGVPGPDGPADSFGLDFRMPEGSQLNGVLVFYVDGLNAEIFNQMLWGGELGAIRKYFVDRGLYAPRATANLPSVTLANLTSFVTGKMPGHHGVTGINWFDRNQLIWRNYETIHQKNTLDGDYNSPTLYERLHDRTTASIFFQPHRGSTRWIENWMSAGPPYFFGWYEFIDRLTLSRLNKIIPIAQARKEFPGVTICYLLAPDFYAYARGVNSVEYRDAIRHSDRQIGRVLGDVERAGLLDKIHIALVSDHSLGEVTRHAPMTDRLDALGLELAHRHMWEKRKFEQRMRYYRGYSTVLYGSGDRYAALCLRKPIRQNGDFAGFEAWPVRPDAEDLQAYPVLSPPKRHGIGGWFAPRPARTYINLIAELLKDEAVDALAWKVGPDQVRLRRRGGEVEFAARADGAIACRVVSGNDPLGYAGKVPASALAGQPATGRQWMEWTHMTDFPDLPEQLVAYFRAPRAGDLVVFATEGWDLANKHRAGHGGLFPSDVAVPMALAGPQVPKGTLGAVRVIDMTATILELLGRPVPDDLDARSLLQNRALQTLPATRPAR